MESALLNDINLDEIPVKALGMKTREKLACMLNNRKLILSPDGLNRDFRGLAELMNLSLYNCWLPQDNPVEALLEKSENSLGDLQRFFEQIDRFDVLDDNRELFFKDAAEYKRKISQMTPAQRLIDSNEINRLSVDDLYNSGKTYDAFLLYVDEDVEFAAKIINTLESEKYNLKLCLKDRNLLGGTQFEHTAIMRLIAERCGRLIVILSKEFLESDKHTFLMQFGQFLNYEKRGRRTVIPVVYSACVLPDEIRMYFSLDYRRRHIADFWYMLYKAVIKFEVEPPKSVQICELQESPKPVLRAIENGTVSMTDKYDAVKITASEPKLPPMNENAMTSTQKQRRKTIKSKLNKIWKRIPIRTSKKLSKAESVACAS